MVLVVLPLKVEIVVESIEQLERPQNLCNVVVTDYESRYLERDVVESSSALEKTLTCLAVKRSYIFLDYSQSM